MMLYDIYVFFVSAIHVAEYTNELLFFGGRVSLKQKHTKLKHRRIAHAFCLVLRLAAKSFPGLQRTLFLLLIFRGRGAPKQSDINH